MVFSVNALLISPKRFDEIILDFYQDAGIWIVIASCVAEYLLLLTYIGVAAYDFFKNRKMMKKMNVQRRTYAFLKFDESHRDVGNRWHDSVSGGRAAASRGAPAVYRLAGLGAAPVRKGQDNPSTNNPQLLKFDGESAPPPVKVNLRNGHRLMRSMKQISGGERKE